eukprot:6711979-Ditylum_brightwellii.AAC.1
MSLSSVSSNISIHDAFHRRQKRAHLVHVNGSSCNDDEAHVEVDLIVSELSNGSGWSITDNKGIEYMGSCAGCTRLRRRTKMSIADCIHRSKCGGGGGN